MLTLSPQWTMLALLGWYSQCKSQTKDLHTVLIVCILIKQALSNAWWRSLLVLLPQCLFSDPAPVDFFCYYLDVRSMFAHKMLSPLSIQVPHLIQQVFCNKNVRVIWLRIHRHKNHKKTSRHSSVFLSFLF